MCGRFFVDKKDREIDRLLKRLGGGADEIKLGEIFPANLALTLVKGEDGSIPKGMEWGLPRWDGKGVIFNARAETALEKPMFRSSLLANPLAVPASGFFEWKDAPDGGKEKFFFHSADGELLYLAGFGKHYSDSPPRFSILTTEANDSVKNIHNRMPLLVARDELEEWMAGDNISSFLARRPIEIVAEKVEATKTK